MNKRIIQEAIGAAIREAKNNLDQSVIFTYEQRTAGFAKQGSMIFVAHDQIKRIQDALGKLAELTAELTMLDEEINAPA